MLSTYEKNNQQLRNELDQQMLHIFDGRKEKRQSMKVKYYVSNDPRAHYKEIYNYESY